MAKKTIDDNTGKRSASTAFKKIDDLLNSPGGGCSTALDRMEQSSWILFLRYLDAREEDRKMEAELRGEEYTPILPSNLSWGAWAWPVKADGTFDLENSLKGDQLIEFVKTDLLPGLKALRDTAEVGSATQQVGNVFQDLQCRISSGYTLREVIDLIQPLSFQTEEDRHELTVLYEDRLNDMGNAGRNGGQYYTPRPLIRVMVRLLDPQIGETFYDGACGSGGFLCEAYKHLLANAGTDPKAWNQLQTKSIYGSEVKPLAYMTSLMNCILHGLETPNLKLQDTLSENIANYQDTNQSKIKKEERFYDKQKDTEKGYPSHLRGSFRGGYRLVTLRCKGTAAERYRPVVFHRETGGRIRLPHLPSRAGHEGQRLLQGPAGEVQCTSQRHH